MCAGACEITAKVIVFHFSLRNNTAAELFALQPAVVPLSTSALTTFCHLIWLIVFTPRGLAYITGMQNINEPVSRSGQVILKTRCTAKTHA